MTDPRYKKLAKLLVEYSIRLVKGDRALLDMIDVPDDFSIELMRAVRAAGATPVIEVRHTRINREMLRETDCEHAGLMRDLELFRLRKVQAYIAIRGSANASENADVASEQMGLYSRITRPVLNYRVNKTRWCVLRWPTPSMAQAAGMSTEAFENLYFDVCTMDYRKMARAMVPLERRMRKADRVHIKGPQTDLTFSIKGIGAKMCKGDRNIPDGEVFSCPARYTGEFSLGFNPYILNPMCDILFDEKIAGSLHLTPGQAYEECDNGNRSAVHWDMVLIQRPEWGGGEIWFDGELIRKNGMFLPKDLRGLNPASLK